MNLLGSRSRGAAAPAAIGRGRLPDADDAIIVAAVLRSVVRRAGAEAMRRHWRGTPDDLAALARVPGLRLEAAER